MPNNAYNLIVFRIVFEMLYLVYSFSVEKQTNKNCSDDGYNGYFLKTIFPTGKSIVLM